MNQPNTPRYSRDEIAGAVLRRLDPTTVATARNDFVAMKTTQAFQVDGLLPEEMARAIYDAFPKPAEMRELKTLREHKYVAAQMNRFHPQAEEALFAFHAPEVIDRIFNITGITELRADSRLYAGGISLMARENFLNPHLDNSHDSDRRLYRVLNLLYYVSPAWEEANGGSLELWPDGLKGLPHVIPATFNRLVVMTTGPESWHSVSAICTDSPRCCVSNYYFSPAPPGTLLWMTAENPPIGTPCF